MSQNRTVEQLLDFAREVWAHTSEPEREAWKARIIDGGIPDDMDVATQALRLFAAEIGAI